MKTFVDFVAFSFHFSIFINQIILKIAITIGIGVTLVNGHISQNQFCTHFIANVLYPLFNRIFFMRNIGILDIQLITSNTMIFQCYINFIKPIILILTPLKGPLSRFYIWNSILFQKCNAIIS